MFRKKAPKIPIVSDDGKMIDLSNLSSDTLAMLKSFFGRVTAENITEQSINEIATIHGAINIQTELKMLARCNGSFGSTVEEIKFFLPNRNRK